MEGGMYKTESGRHGLNFQHQQYGQAKVQDVTEPPKAIHQPQPHACGHADESIQGGQYRREPVPSSLQQGQHQQSERAQQSQLVQHQQMQQLVSIPPEQHDRHQHQQQQPQQQQHSQQHGKSAAQIHDNVVTLPEPSLLSDGTSKSDDACSSLWKLCSNCNMPIPLYMLQRHLADCQAQRDRTNGGSELTVSRDGQSVFACSICAKILPDRDSVQEHEQSHGGPSANRQGATNSQPGSIFMCSVCRLQFLTTEDLIKHVDVHLKGDSKEGSCQVCQQVFQHPINLLQHIETHHGHLKPCPCGEVFPNKQEFREHQDLCLPVLRDPASATDSAKSYKCRLCPKIFGTVQSRLQHERVHRRSVGDSQLISEKIVNKTDFVCSLCKQEFNCRENFRAHVRSHTGEKPYGCRHCLKSFSSLQGRWQHEKIHKR